MDVCLVIKRRLEELGLEQKDLARASEVTESYISQLLARKKLPPAPDRTDIYEKMAKFLKLPSDRLAKLAEYQRREELKKGLAGPPAPMFAEIRELILRKCVAAKAKQVSAIFEKQPFGELERLVTQKLLDVVKTVVREELNSENWLHLMARLAGRSYEQMRVTLLEFLDTDVFSLSPENCVSFLDPLIESWDVDLTTFGMEIVLNRRVASGDPRRFAFVETGPGKLEQEPGFKEFLKDRSLSGTATTEEIELLKKLRFNGKRPTSLYYYRELQSLRDPLHFRAEDRPSVKNSVTKMSVNDA
ncbi:MAG: XRE family transcriptional regulator [Acidobacteria bacterium]|nr:MAG: XRE family transcriptional regulator [Acidobacteriota bacterium]